MSELRVDSVKSKGGGAPNLPKGVTISGITTAVTLGVTNIDGTNVNVSGVVTSGTLSGELLSTGTPTLGLGVTINSSGVVISGVATAGIVTATTLYGDGSNITGVGVSIAPLFYNPDASDSSVSFGTGIGITFNQQIKAGTGNITIRETNASGTVVENFGVGSSVTISENRVSFTPTSNLSENVVYHLSYPSGCFTNNEGTDYVGTAYTFKSLAYDYNLFSWGNNGYGQLGVNSQVKYSSPVQVPGTTWKHLAENVSHYGAGAIRSDGTLWAWGTNTTGGLGINDVVKRSSPVQVGSDTTWSWAYLNGEMSSFGVKTDGTLWSWGSTTDGRGGRNSNFNVSSPVQIGSDTDWATGSGKVTCTGAIKTDGTLWTWGSNQTGKLGVPSIPTGNPGARSSPIQVPGTTWNTVGSNSQGFTLATKTDGTLWGWGSNTHGRLGLNNTTQYSSPTQIPGSIWAYVEAGYNQSGGTKTDGTLWVWGQGNTGIPGTNRTTYSSPIQISGTWKTGSGQMTIGGGGGGRVMAVKSDGTLWAWGGGELGELGQNQNGQPGNRSSPVQVGSGTDWNTVRVNHEGGAWATTKST